MFGFVNKKKEQGMVKLTFHDANDRHEHFASGTFIKFKGKVLLATAAHCVYDPMRREGPQKIYVEETINGILHKGLVIETYYDSFWKSDGLLGHDNAFCTVDFFDNYQPDSYEAVFDYIPSSNNNVLVEGISSGWFINRHMSFRGRPDMTMFKNDKLIGLHSGMKQGVSGGPLLISCNGIQKQAGVISAYFAEFPKYVWCTVWTEDTFHLADKIV